MNPVDNIKANPQSLLMSLFQDVMDGKSDIDYSNLAWITLDYIKNGEIAQVEELFRTNFSNVISNIDKFFDDNKKNIEYMTINSICLYSCGAILGGTNSQIILAIQKNLCRKILDINQIQDYYNLNYEALIAFTTIVKHTKETPTGSRDVEKAKSYIRQKIYTKLPVKDVAENCGINADYLSRLFLEKTGVTLKKYIQDQKINAACHLLKYTDYPLSYIATLLDFSTQSHFGNVFKKCKGETPAQYRNYTENANIF